MYTQQAEAIERERKRIVCVWYWFPNLLSWLSFYSGSNLIGLSFVGYPNWIEPSNIHICHPGEEMLKKEIKLSYDLYLKVIFILKVVFSALELSMSFIYFLQWLPKQNQFVIQIATYFMLICWYWRTPVAAISQHLVQPFGNPLHSLLPIYVEFYHFSSSYFLIVSYEVFLSS